MLRKISLNVLMLMIFTGLSGQTINTNDSKVTFSVSNMAFNTVTGSFKGMEGTLLFSPDDLATSKIAVCIDASTVDTENEKRDEHLKNEDFFEVAKYPKICFKSSEIVKTATGYKATGILTMHGVSKTVTIPFTLVDKKFIGDFELNRKDYNIGETTSNFMVGKDIAIQIVCIIN